MGVNWDKDAILKKYSDRADDCLVVIGAQLNTWQAEICPVDTSNLVNSLTYATDKEQGETRGKTDGTAITIPDTKHTVRTGSNVYYAKYVEFMPGYSYLRRAFYQHKSDINKIIESVMRG